MAMTRTGWLDQIGAAVTRSGAVFDDDYRAGLERMTLRELSTVHLLLCLVTDPVARRYQRQKLLCLDRSLPRPNAPRKSPRKISTAGRRR